jgi:hypothetical protein
VKAFARTPGNKIRVLLPDPDHPETMAELARRFDYKPADLAEMISESHAFFTSFPRGKNAKVEVKFVQKVPLFTFYIFDPGAIIAFYSHRGKEPVPTFVVSLGSLYEFVRKEFDGLWKVGREVAPPAGPPAAPTTTTPGGAAAVLAAAPSGSASPQSAPANGPATTPPAPPTPPDAAQEGGRS